MKLENINFKGETYNFSFSRYSSSNFIAILMGLPDDEYPDIITTNNSVMEKDENDPTEYVQIRTDNPEYVKLLVNNGLIEDRPDFIMPQGYYENSVSALGLTRKYLSSAKGLPYLVKYHIGIDNTYKEMQKVRKLISTKTTVNDAKQTLKELNLIK